MTGGDVWSARMRMVDAVLAPFKAVTLGQVFDRVVEEFPHHPAFIFEDRQCSYLEFARLVAQAERGLWRLGVRQGEHIALVMPNSPEWMAVFAAAARIGAPGTRAEHVPTAARQRRAARGAPGVSRAADT